MKVIVSHRLVHLLPHILKEGLSQKKKQRRCSFPTFRSLKKHFCVCVLTLFTRFLRKLPHLKVLKKEDLIYFSNLLFESAVFTAMLNTSKISNTGINGRGSPLF